MIDFFIAVIIFSLVIVWFVYEMVNEQRFTILLYLFMFICYGAYGTVTSSTAFDEIDNEHYGIIAEDKAVCLKYDDCRAYFNKVWEDDRIKEYEYVKLISIIEEKPETKEKIEKIKIELIKDIHK